MWKASVKEHIPHEGGMTLIWSYLALLAIGIAAHLIYRRWSKSRERKPEPKLSYTKRLTERMSAKSNRQRGLLSDSSPRHAKKHRP